MKNICRYLDHAVLKPSYTPAEAMEQMLLGLEYNVKSICVRPCDIEVALKLAAGSDTAVGCVLSFPHGCCLPASKADEARRYVALGVAEIDMVVNYGLIRSCQFEALCEDIASVTEIAGSADVLVKTIFETSELTIEEIEFATRAAIEAEADFVKTSTGFSSNGASPEAINAMLKAGEGKIQVKASGGIRNRETAQMYIDMGVTRLGVGSTSTPVICTGQAGSGDGY